MTAEKKEKNMVMGPVLISDELWKRIERLLPEKDGRARGGRPPVSDYIVLNGVVYIIKTGIAWEDLPASLGCGSGMTCWRRLWKWNQQGVWKEICDILRGGLEDGEEINWQRSFFDTSLPPVRRRSRKLPEEPSQQKEAVSSSEEKETVKRTQAENAEEKPYAVLLQQRQYPELNKQSGLRL